MYNNHHYSIFKVHGRIWGQLHGESVKMVSG